ncbi:Inhibitor of the KinA pathway to sporulation, predicted exonuclease [Desulfonispora thiosulfatigenes DSM 11270]|uniref:Inhibitor of the KinA pathway to sporulation, predicted exonuclease n=1 Tax=Desulfonispora thiosulfatigenes DSM 11270 TaxID=656914 RepID=A0A1W1VRT5_DESTI|nr:3'-5' exonuclease [Desulfonispora thiosulfatigenes]SMB96092.1 Inhibitor of the KinA pathway to sporulation, predicted exonuclease [Desulfonispora thiosulfatigenes DSM 11270]
MNYIVFDLEYNQHFNYSNEKKRTINKHKCPFEIIQIGAIKLDSNFKTISTFDKLVKPIIYKRIHPYVKKITGITKDQLSTEKQFPEIYEEFVEFISPEKCVFCIWGGSDMKELFSNIKYHQLDSTLIPRDYIDIQSYATNQLNFTKGNNVGLSKAVEMFEIPQNNDFHNAFNDAYYTAEIFKLIYNEKIIPKTYNQQNSIRKKSTSPKVDTYRLIKQFEKMFNRNISDEEKKIIKLAYLMGKTNQFTFKAKE